MSIINIHVVLRGFVLNCALKYIDSDLMNKKRENKNNGINTSKKFKFASRN